MTPIHHVFCDIGGVLGSNGWDHLERARAAEAFELDLLEFQRRHDQVVDDWECGRMELSEYLDATVFYQPRGFSRRGFVDFMHRQSMPEPESIAVIVRVQEAHRCTLMTLNNESTELNRYRLEHFGLRGIFSAFLSSCYLGLRKPDPRIYHQALGIAQAEPRHTLMIDDREPNLEPARAMGIRVHHYTSPKNLAAELTTLGLLP